jgi:hypothetical protein
MSRIDSLWHTDFIAEGVVASMRLRGCAFVFVGLFVGLEKCPWNKVYGRCEHFGQVYHPAPIVNKKVGIFNREYLYQLV